MTFLQQKGIVSKKVEISSVVNNPADEFVTVGPAQGVISKYCQSIPLKGYGRIEDRLLENGLYELVDGHHRVAALRNLGMKYIRIYLTK